MEPTANSSGATSNAVANFFHQESEAASAVKIAAFIVIILLSFTGNATIIAIIYKNANHRMRNISNLFIANMAVSNLFLVFGNVPFSITSALSKGVWFAGGGTFGRALCKFCMFVWFLSELLSSASLSAIAIDRFLLVFFPTKHFISKRVAFASIGFSWAFAVGFSSPLFRFTDIFKLNDKLYCIMNIFMHESIAQYMVIAFAIFIAMPIAVLTCLYTAIVLKLLGRKTVGENVSSERKERKRKENYRTCVLLLVSVLLFAVCVLPFWMGNTYCMSTLDWGSWVCSKTYLDISFVLTVVNAGTNPFIYLFFSQAFRNGARNLFFKVPLSQEDISSTKTKSRRQTNRVEPRMSTSAL